MLFVGILPVWLLIAPRLCPISWGSLREIIDETPWFRYVRDVQVFYLSDLHLRDADSPQAQRLQRFLSEIPAAGDVVLLGGDVFDLFVGNKRVFRHKFAPVLSSIEEVAARGCRIVFLEGNHDFHLRGVFGAGVELRSEEFGLNVAGRELWVCHGDLIDEEDRGYRLLYAVTRNLFFRAFLWLLPGEVVEGIGRWSSRESRKVNDTSRMSEERRARTRRLFLAYAQRKAGEGKQHMLVGHSHFRDQTALGPSAEYVNLGFASEHLPYGHLEAGATRFALREFL